ncbi:MAG: cytochrome P450 [Streptosporangiales bacterium]|nr:cytochrome P450 [Streptosporangiales bacterium]
MWTTCRRASGPPVRARRYWPRAHGRSTVIDSVFDQDYLRDPHQVFARLRHEGPVTQTATGQGVKVWLVTRYEDVKAAMTDPRISKAFRNDPDVFKDYAVPLPAMVIGVPEADWPRMIHLSSTTIEGSAGDPKEVVAAAEETLAYLTDLCAAKRAQPADDLISAMVQVHDEGGRLNETELVSTAWLLLVAGHETTVHLISNGMLALLSHPDQLARLRADLGLLPDAIEEFLRYDGPISTSTLRFTTEPVTIGGVDIPAGQLILVSLLAANRDAGQYDDADRFDVTRKAGQHLAFGHGIHYCLGAPLARVEGAVAFRQLLERFPALELTVPAHELAWREGMLMHGLTSLPVRAA